MSLATKYAMKRRMSKAPCKACEGGTCMAHGGKVEKDKHEHVTGVHKPLDEKRYGPGKSAAGLASPGISKIMHEDKLAEMKSMKKPHLYADGGPVIDPEKGKQGQEAMRKAFHFASGGMVDEEMASGYTDALIERIMKSHAYSKGGQVANETEPVADSEPAEFDELVKDDGLEFHETGANSGDKLGDAAVEDEEHDLIGSIMKSRKKKDKMPRPA